MSQLGYSSHGAGEPLVLLHRSDYRAGVGSRLPALALHFRVVAVDLPGFGASELLHRSSSRRQPLWPQRGRLA